MKTRTSKRRLAPISVAFAMLLAATDAAHAVTWTGEGNDTRWSNPANWGPKGQPPLAYPTGNQSAEISDAVVDLDVDISISSVTLGGSGNGGTIRGAGGNLSITDRLQIANGGFFSGPATSVNVASTATVAWAGGYFNNAFTSNFTLNNAGRFEWTNGPIYFDGTLNNAATALFVIFGDHGFGSAARSGVINNAGRIIKESGNGVTQFSGFTPQTNQINTTLNNTGSVAVASGTIQIGSGTSTGSFEVGTGKTLLVGGNGDHVFQEPATFTGGGTCSFSGASRIAGAVTTTLDMEVLNGLVAGDGAGIDHGSFEGSGRLLWKGGSINGTFTIPEGFHSILSGGAAKTYDGTFTNKGTMDWFGPGPLATNSSTFRNEGVFNVFAAGTFLADTYINGQTFLNIGTLNTFPGGTSQTDDTSLVNSGVLNVGGIGHAGILRIGGGFTQTATGTLRMEIAGTDPAAPQFDQLLAGGKSLNGKLIVDTINNFAPPKDARFVLIDSHSGKFARVSTPGGEERTRIEYPGNSRTELVSLSDGPILFALWVAGRDLAANELPDRDSDAAAVNETAPQWSYGYRQSVGGTDFSLFSAAQHQNGLNHPEIDGWTAGAGVSVAVNTGATPVTISNGGADSEPLQPEQLLMLPTPFEYAVARWTAPESGTFNIAARWVDVDANGGNGATGHVVVNGRQIFGGQNAESKLYTGARWADGGKAAMAPRSLQLAAGDVVDFVVGANGEAGQDLTAVNAIVRRGPAVTISAPTTAVAGQEVTVSVNSSSALTAVALRKDGMNIGTDTEAPFEFVLKDLTPGIYHLEAEATAGDVVGASNVITLTVNEAAAQASARRANAATAAGSTYECITSGTWDRADIWRRQSDNGNGVPGPDDTVILPNSVEVVLDTNRTVKKVFSEGRIAGETGNTTRELTVTGQLSTSGSMRDMTIVIPAGGVLTNVRSSSFFENVNVLNAGEMVVTQTLFAAGGTLTNTGKVTLRTPPASGGPILLQADSLNLHGTIAAAPGVAIAGRLVGLDGGSLVGNDGGTLVGNDGGTLVGLDGGSLVATDGTTLVGLDGGSLVGLDGGSLVGLDGGSLVGNDGGSLVGLDGGSLVGNDGASLSQVNSATLVGLDGGSFQTRAARGASTRAGKSAAAATAAAATISNGGTLAGNCNVIGSLVNDGGFVMPGQSAGRIFVAGDYQQTASGAMVLEIGGTETGTFDKITVTGTAALGGKLFVKTINGFAPSSGTTVTPLVPTTVSGNFDFVSSNAQIAFTDDGMTAQVSGPNPPAPKALNIATRMRVETGDNALIAGFIITGDAPKKVIIRGIGPSLPVSGALGDPTLDLDAGAVTNDDWRTNQEGEIAATGIPPSSDAESAIVATLQPGAHTAILRGKDSGTGVGLVEVYDLEGGSPVQLANIATRGQVQTGDNVMIGGFIIGGDYPSKVLLRAIGPSLPVPGALQDPVLDLVDANGATITNDNWRATQEAEIGAIIPPTDDREAAIIATLVPGGYTAIVRGADNTTGVALVEGYNLQ